ncbi:MAG: ketopantoate reductase family protein [Dokdonella sp.]|uniref:ketopantoate reductase family protein n=2 Tax=Dokdonella sp. TaxID=2291710 RepID=UPI003BB0C893
MRVLVLGAGATGGYYGARMIQSGADVTFLVRAARATALDRNGLHVRAIRDPVHTRVRAVSSIAGATPFDLVLLSCKAYDLGTAIDAIRPAMETGACVLPLLNGVRHLDTLDAAFGKQKVLGGLCHISVTLDTDGSIRQVGTIDRLTFGRRSGNPPLTPTVRDGLLSIRSEVANSDDILSAMWNKFSFLATLAAATCLMRASIGEIVAVPDGADLVRWLYLECAEIARRSGHAPDESAVAEAMEILTTPHSPLKASMLRDVEKRQRTEVEHVLGDMLARATALGVDTPLLGAACTQLRVHEALIASGQR